MADSKESAGGGIGLTTVLFLIFLVLKLTGTIDWSWWWVTCPLWIPLAVVVGAIAAVVAIFLIIAATTVVFAIFANTIDVLRRR